MSCQVALNYTRKHGADKVRVLTLVKNRGKGGAVRMVRLSKHSMSECRERKILKSCIDVSLTGNSELQRKSHSDGRC